MPQQALQFGTYEVLEEIGKGGMATVYRARQPSIDRDVAIKVIKANIGDIPDAMQRFQREARLIARLEHPHILPIYDFDGNHEPPYIVMRYLDGGTLKDAMRSGLLPLGEVVYLIQQVASALDYAHRQGIVHRDIKPSNILIDRDGNTFVSDLGIARISGGADTPRTGITLSGMVVGTPEYMSPEQAMAREDVDFRADIYSLGVMLFEMLTGQLPFTAENAMGVLLKHMQSPIPSALKLQPNLPGNIDYVLSRAMAKEPEARFGSAGELARELSQTSGGTVTITPVRLQAAAAESLTWRTEKRTVSEDQTSKISTDSQETPQEQQRQMTVLHLNVADFEELLIEANPEEAGATLTALLDQLQRLAERGGGWVRERTAATLQVLWGVNEVHESDPENAIFTALVLREEAQRQMAEWLGEGEELPFQIGIDTGPVLVQVNPSGAPTTSGVPITIATRIERAAPAGSILITHDTFRHVIGIFDAVQESAVRVRGRSEPIEVYAVERARPRAFRLQTRGVEGIETRMIGRDGELKLLQDTLLLAIEDRETQMVTVTADAGVGKSRLLFEFSRWIDVIEQTVRFFEGRATQQNTNFPYALIRSIFAFRFEILDSDTSDVMRAKFSDGIAGFLGAQSSDAAAQIGHLVGFDFGEHPAVKPILSSAEAFQRQALAHLQTFFQSIAATPAIIELEDIHWADTQSLDLIDRLVTENRNLPLMVIAMARPELYERRPGWGEGQAFHHRLDLKPLSKLDTRRLVREVLQKVDDIPAAIRDLIVERADGNPFYVEELIKILIEDGVIIKGTSENAAWHVLPERLSDLRVPPTLTGVLQARLDTLEPAARLLLGRASVIGRTFWTSAVTALENADGFHVERADRLLEDLRRRELIYLREKSDFAGTQEYVIKHAILRDVIYESLLKRQQRVYHAAAAAWLIRVSAERSDEYNVLIAEHYEKASQPTQAAAYRLRAARKAIAVSGLDDAAALISSALLLLPPEGEDDLQQLRLQLQVEQVWIHWHRWQIEAVTSLAAQALDIARKLDEGDIVALLLAHLGLNEYRRGDYTQMGVYLREAEPLVDRITDPRIRLFVLRQIGNLYIVKSATIPTAVRYYERSLALAREIQDGLGEAGTLNSLGNAYMGLNQLAEARAYYEKSIAQAKAIGALSAAGIALANLLQVYYFQGDLEKALNLAYETLALYRQIDADPIGVEGTVAQILVLMNASRENVITRLKPHLEAALARHLESDIVNDIETFIYLLTREGSYERAAELLGVWYASPITDSGLATSQLYPNKARVTIAEHLSAEALEAAITRGRTFDIFKTAQALLATL